MLRAASMTGATLFMLLTATATHIPCAVTGAQPEVNIGGAYYIDVDLCDFDVCTGAAVWVYQEANDILGLQRRDPFMDETCGIIPPDRFILGFAAPPILEP